MRRLIWMILTLALICGPRLAPLRAAEHRPSNLQALVDQAAAGALEQFAERKLQSNQLAMSCIDLRDPAHLVEAHFRSDTPIYPASVVKLFYLAAAHRWLEDGKFQDTPELRRAMRDMIVQSYNEATHYLVDLLTGTTSGPELPAAELEAWTHQRNAVNRYFAGLGYERLNINQKPWCEGPYGRERVFVGQSYENRNALTTRATARLLASIALRREVSPARSEEMLELLQRDPANKKDAQASEYIGAALPAGAKLWSKAGWTSATRHDAAYVELPGGARCVLVIFTTGAANEKKIIPAIARMVLEGLVKP